MVAVLLDACWMRAGCECHQTWSDPIDVRNQCVPFPLDCGPPPPARKASPPAPTVLARTHSY